jgi:hypothetical protein
MENKLTLPDATNKSDSDITRICNFMKHHILKIFLLIFLLIIILISFRNFGYFQTSSQKYKSFHMEQTKKFTGFKKLIENNKIESSDKTFPKEKLHFIVYGRTGSGKTTFIRRYINKHFTDNNNIYIYCKDLLEWKEYPKVYTSESLGMLENMEQFRGTPDNPSLIILDDMGNLIHQKTISEIFTKGRHNNIKIVVLAHKACDVDNKIRGNIDIFYTTTQNNSLFFTELNKNYNLNLFLGSYCNIEYGIIRVNTILQQYTVYDQEMRLLYDTQTEIHKVPSNFNIGNYTRKRILTNAEITNIIVFLERESIDPIQIVPITFYFYFDYYLNKILKLKTPAREETESSLNQIKDILNTLSSGYGSLSNGISKITSSSNKIQTGIEQINKYTSDS